MIRLLSLLSFLVVGGVAPASSEPQQLDELIQQALDQTVRRIEINNQPIPEALNIIERETGVRFTLDPTALELMPYGPATRVTLLVENMPLRDALRQVVDRFALDWRVENDRVHIEPAPALRRIGRRASVAELRLFERLASAPLDPNLPIEFRVDPAQNPADAFNRAIQQAGTAPAARQLEAASAALGWVWIPRDEHVVLYSRRDFYRERFDAPLDLNYARIPLDELLLDLGRRSAVPVAFEPGSMARSGAAKRSVDLVQRQMSPRQAFELISGRTGLKYDLTDDGVHISCPDASATPASGPMTVRLTIPIGNTGATVEFLIPEESLPAELRALKEEKLQELLQRVREGR